MTFKTESRFSHYLLLFHSLFFLNPVSSDDKGTITMVSVHVNTEEGGKGKFVHVCGGTLITNSVIFTGCSCITEPPKPGADDKDKVDLLTPDQVRVSAGVSEAKKSDQIRMQSAVAYALSVHDLCDSTYIYNYGMVKLTTSFVLENGLELSHALSLDMSNYEKSIKSMGPKDCWTEIWTSVESPDTIAPETSMTVPTPSTLTSSTWSPSEYNDTLDESPLVETSGDEPPGEEDSSADQPSGSSTPSEEFSADDDSGTEPNEDASGDSGDTSSHSGFKDHSSNTPVYETESEVATVRKRLPHEISTETVETASASPTLPVTFEPSLKSEVVDEYEDVSTLPPVIVTEEQNATEPANNATNTTSMIHANETVTIGASNTNETAVTPQEVAANNESLSAFNSSAGVDAANATGNEGVTGNENPAQTPLTAARKGRRRRFPSSDKPNVSYERYYNPAIPPRMSRQAGPVPKDAPPAGANITAGSANASLAGELSTGLNGTEGANASSAAGVGLPDGMNGTNVGPNSNASDTTLMLIPSFDASGGDNETTDYSQIPVEVNTSAVVNQTESDDTTIEDQTEPNTPPANISIEIKEEAETTIQIKTTAVDLVTKNVRAKLLVSTEIPEVTSGSGGISEGTEESDGESGTDESDKSDSGSGSGKDGGIEEGSAESEEVESSGTEHVEEASSVKVPPTELMSPLSSSPPPPPPPPPPPSPAPPPKPPSKSHLGPASQGTPRGVGRMLVSILDWKECEGLVCPDPSKKCDSSSDDTKWCLSAMKDGARVCEADTGSPVYCKKALMGILSNVGLTCPKDTSKGIAVGLDQAFEYIKSMMGMPDFQKKVPPAETKQRKSGTPKGHNPSATQAIIGSIIAFLLI